MKRVGNALWRLAERETSNSGRGRGRGDDDTDNTMARTRQSGVRATGTLALVLAAAVLPGCTLEQILIGQWYNIATPQAGACPRLEWRFVVNAQRSIGGFLSRDGQQPIANLTGVLNADDSYQMTATDVAGTRTATVTGKFTSLVSTMSIHGDAAGSACDGQTFNLRLGGYFTRQGGWSGGGGG
jgi:hypothetical protein